MPHEREPSASAPLTTPCVAPLVASLVGVAPDGSVHLDLPGTGRTTARVLSSVSRVELRGASPGRQVLVVCEGGDPARPIVVGLLEDALDELVSAAEEPVDRVVSAARSITLVCGDASLTLHADGRVVTRGVNVVSVASEQQRIQGAVVRIN